jgi:hypothetical protein
MRRIFVQEPEGMMWASAVGVFVEVALCMISS